MDKEKLETKTITVYPSVWKEFGSMCDSNGYDRSKLIRLWIDRWLEKRKQT